MAEPAREWTAHDLQKVAKRQRRIIMTFAGGFFAMFIMPPAAAITSMVMWGTLIFLMFGLAQAIRDSTPGLYVIFGLVPVFGLLALVHLNSRATGILRSNGMKVGFSGVDPDAFARGYDHADAAGQELDVEHLNPNATIDCPRCRFDDL